MADFFGKPTEYAKENESLRLDFNYETSQEAKDRKDTSPIFLLQDKYTIGDYADSVEFSLEQAKWLMKELEAMIKFVEE